MTKGDLAARLGYNLLHCICRLLAGIVAKVIEQILWSRFRTRFTRLLCYASHERAAALRPETAHWRSLISHSRPAVSVSCASGLGGLCSWSKKYAPLTFATCGEVASHTRVSAPFSGLRATGLRIVIPKFISRPLLRLNPVATSPGWKQFAVTPVPSRRRASSVVNGAAWACGGQPGRPLCRRGVVDQLAANFQRQATAG